LKLAGGLYQEVAESEETDQEIMNCLDKICKIEPENCSEALILKGKLHHRRSEFKEAIPVFDRAIQLQALDDENSPPKA
jgi:tetratricopeptide (TPR) repeat protein